MAINNSSTPTRQPDSEARAAYRRAWSLIRSINSSSRGRFTVDLYEALAVPDRVRGVLINALSERPAWDVLPLRERRDARQTWEHLRATPAQAPRSVQGRWGRPLPLRSEEIAAMFPEVTAETATRQATEYSVSLGWQLADGREAYFVLAKGQEPICCGTSRELARRAYQVGQQVAL